MTYEIRKVKCGADGACSFGLDENVIFDVYGVYIRKVDVVTSHQLLDWVEDFTSLLEAESFINTNAINNNKKG